MVKDNSITVDHMKLILNGSKKVYLIKKIVTIQASIQIILRCTVELKANLKLFLKRNYYFFLLISNNNHIFLQSLNTIGY